MTRLKKGAKIVLSSNKIIFFEILVLDLSKLIYFISYNWDIINFDNSIFQNYDLCSQDSLSYKNIYLVMDLVNEYQLINQNNNQDKSRSIKINQD